MSKAQKHSLISVCVEGLGGLNPGSWDKNYRSLFILHTCKKRGRDSHFSGLKRESDFYEVLKIMLSRRTNFKDNILFFENFVHAHNVYD